ncbi:hypothetical protein EJ06DRAFT_579488 [Trichodelitschia bisporula]|uniref:C2H2-type domain-containing protein n=1 Tax=Trichodelitschia bisporula TaxID=703511 RepID=A0A6G1I571_9PEZI|nr:hypothetical protein EJ06DRAFT_579488 [Trichodelitschia bisporula]
MDCKWCRRSFSKGEHLRRHERSHTGARPFVCKVCRRPFSRQDSLSRHERLHVRPLGAASTETSRPTTSEAPVSPESLPQTENGTSGCNGSRISVSSPEVEQQLSTANAFPVTQSMDLDYELIWPESEELFHSIMEPSALPFLPAVFPQIDLNMRAGTPTFLERGLPIDISTGVSQKAIPDVNRLVAIWTSNVAANADINYVFLDECLHMFFVKFIPTFPVLHRATFVYGECIHPLLLSAIAIGSLYLGPADAITKGEGLWRLANAAVTTSWQTFVTHRGPYDSCPGVQLVLTVVLNQMYGMLSKNRQIRTSTQVFNGNINWSKFCGMYDSEPYPMEELPAATASKPEIDRQWRLWVARELQQRALLAHYILDGLNAQVSGKVASLRHTSNQLCLPGEEAAFMALSAEEWLSHMQSKPVQLPTFRSIFNHIFSPTPQPDLHTLPFSAFSLKVILEGVQSMLSDCDDEGETSVGVPGKVDIRRALARMYDCIVLRPSLSTEDRYETLLRWHALGLDTVISSTTLCQVVCRRQGIAQHLWDGSRVTRPGPDLVAWAGTHDARRALLHALQMQEIVESLPRGRAHTIHMPICLFSAATVYSVFLLAGLATVRVPVVVDWKDVVYTSDDPSVALAELTGSVYISDTVRFLRGEPVGNFAIAPRMRNLLYEFNSMQKLFGCLKTQWGVASDMQDVIDQWIMMCH